MFPPPSASAFAWPASRHWLELLLAGPSADPLLELDRPSAQTAMVNQLARRRGVQVITLVRRDAQAQPLHRFGAEHILHSAAPDCDRHRRDRCRQLDARLAFDAVAGAMTARLLNAMPPEARVVVCGGLAGALIRVNPHDLSFNQRRVEGFYLAHWIAHQHPLALLAMQRQLYQLGDLTHAAIQLRAPLEDVQHAIATYEASMSAGKVLLMPGVSTA